MGIEDAYVMSGLLAEVHDASGLEAAFHAFDQIRRPRTQKLVTTSREAGQLWDLEAEGVGDDLQKFRANVQTRMNWIWDVDLEEHLEEGKRVLAAKVR